MMAAAAPTDDFTSIENIHLSENLSNPDDTVPKSPNINENLNAEKPPPPLPLTPKPANTLTQLMNKIQMLESQVATLVADAGKKEQTIANLQDKIMHLESNQMRLESYLIVKENTSTLLQNRVTQLEQYTRRYSVIVKGIPLSEEKGSPDEEHLKLKNEVQKVVESCQSGPLTSSLAEVDKFHRNGRVDGREQDVIIRFKTHSAKEFFYKNRKTIPDRKIKVQPSLSQATRSLLDDAKSALETHYSNADHMDNPPEFVYANLHGTLLVKMKKKMKFGHFLRFDSIEELHRQILKQNEQLSRDTMIAFDAEMEKVANGSHSESMWSITL